MLFPCKPPPSSAPPPAPLSKTDTFFSARHLFLSPGFPFLQAARRRGRVPLTTYSLLTIHTYNLRTGHFARYSNMRDLRRWPRGVTSTSDQDLHSHWADLLCPMVSTCLPAWPPCHIVVVMRRPSGHKSQVCHQVLDFLCHQGRHFVMEI